MLEQLDDIDWSRLEHAYGAASDVPGMIRALADDDGDERAAAFHAAYGNIFHQGTRYSATPKAIPFLVELASQPQPKQLGELLGLIVHCVAGYFSPIGGPYNATGAVWGGVTEPMSDYGETTEILAACEHSAERAVPLCLKLLAHGDAKVRERALHLVAALRQFAERYEVVPRLRDHVAKETHAGVRAMIAFALTHTLPMQDSAVLEAIARDDRDDLVRLLATMGCVRRGTAKNAAELVGWLSDEELGERYTDLPFHADDLAGHIGSLLASLGPGVLRDALPRLVEHLRSASDFGVVGILEAALAAAFGDEPVPAELSEDQRMVLEALVHNQAFWSIGNALTVLQDRELPSMRDEMAAFLGVEIKDDPIEAARIGARMMAPFGAEASLEHWQKVLELAPDDPEALCNAGMTFAELDDHERTLELLRQGLEHVENLDRDLIGRAWFAYGLALHQTDDDEKAVGAFARAQEHLKGDARNQARQNRVAILQALGRTAEALAVREEVPAETTDELYHLGLAQVKAGRYPECIASISRVLAAEPEHSLAHYTIACAYALSGDADNALGSVGRALELAPELAPDVAADSDFDSLKGDQRFRKLVHAAQEAER